MIIISILKSLIWSLTASTTDAVSGTVSDDTIIANQVTFDATDSINGGDGTDTLAIINSAANGGIAPALLQNVENIQMSSQAASSIDLVVTTGVEKVISKNSTGNDTFSNIQSAAAIEIDGTEANVIASYKNSLTGATKAVNVTLKGGATVAELDVGGNGTGEFGIINLASEGATANTLTLIEDEGSAALAALVTVNVTGSADLTLGADATAFAGAGTTINAAAATGNLTVAGTNFETITLGAGDDTLYLGSTQVSQTTASAKVALDGGAGANTLVFGAQDLTASGLLNGAAADADSISNFQTLTFEAKLADGGASDLARAIDANGISSATTISFEAENNDGTAGGADGEDVTVTVSDLVAGQTVKGSFKASATATNDEIVVLDMDSPTGDADAITFESVASSASTAHVNSITTLTVNQTTVATVAESVETLNLVATRAAVSSAAGTQIGAIDAANTATINVSGAGAATIGTVEAADSSAADTTVATLNASALVGGITLGTSSADFQATDADDFSVTLGAGTNAVYGLAALDDGDTITGTTGTDTVYITGGSGAVNLVSIDTVQYTSGNGTTTSAANWDVTTIDVTNSNLSSTISNLKAGQSIKVDDIDNTKTLTLNGATGVTSLSVDFNTATASAGTLATNATTVSAAYSGVDANGDYAANKLTLGATPLVVNVSGGGETSTAGTNSTLTVVNANSGAIDELNSSYNGSLDVSGVYFDTTNGAVVTTGANTFTSTTSTTTSAISNGLVRFADSGGTDVLSTQADWKGGSLGFIQLSGYETLAMEFDMDTSDSGVDTTINLRDVSGLSTILLTEGETDGFEENITLANVPTGTTVKVGGSYGDGADGVSATAATSGSTITISSAGANFTSAHADAFVTTDGFATVNIQAGADNIDLGTNDALVTLTGATTVNIGGDLVSASDDGDITLGTVSATSTVSLNLVAVGGSVSIADIGTMNSLETFTIDASTGETITVTTGTSTSVDTITITGAGGTTISGLTATSLDLIDASAATGSIVLGSSSAAISSASGASINTGTGNDTIFMSVTAVKSINAGEKASDSDTLVLIGNMNSGTAVINLDLADQIVNLNGFADAGVQSSFENVDLNAVSSTGSYGFLVTAAASGSRIQSSKYNDTIVLGDGSDTVEFMGTNGVDTVSNFTSGASGDVLDFDAFLGTTAAFIDANSATVSGAIGASTGAENGLEIAGKVVLVDIDDVADTTALASQIGKEAAAIDDKFILDNGEKAVIGLGDINGTGTGDITWYYVTGTDTATENSETITEVGVTSGVDLDAFVAGNLF